MVHAGERFVPGSWVGGAELLIPAYSRDTPTHYPQVEFGALGWALEGRKPKSVLGDVSDFGPARAGSLPGG